MEHVKVLSISTTILKFYKNVFFPALEEHGIDTVIHMGDAFDSRKSIDYQSFEWAKELYLNH